MLTFERERWNFDLEFDIFFNLFSNLFKSLVSSLFADTPAKKLKFDAFKMSFPTLLARLDKIQKGKLPSAHLLQIYFDLLPGQLSTHVVETTSFCENELIQKLEGLLYKHPQRTRFWETVKQLETRMEKETLQGILWIISTMAGMATSTRLVFY